MTLPPRPALPPPRPPAPRLGATKQQRLLLLAGLLAAGLLLLNLFSSILLPFVLASAVAYFLDPLTTRLTRFGLPRGLAATIMVLALVVFGLLVLLLLYPLVLAQIVILIGRIPTYVAALNELIREALSSLQERFGPEFVDDRLRELASTQVSTMLSFIGTALARLIGGGVAIFNVLTLAIVTPIVAFYLLRDWPRIVARVDSWLPRRYAAVLRAQAREIDRILSAWLRGQLLCSLLLAIYYSLALSAVGLELGLIVGLTAGVLSFIPYVGTITGALISLGMAMVQFQTWDGVVVVMAVFFLGNLVEGYIIYPRLLGDRVELHAVWVLFALFAGGAVMGFAGVLMAVPAAAVIGVVARFWLRKYLQSPLYLDPPTPDGGS